MSLETRNRFRADSPFPEGGVITPDVFPSLAHPDHGRLDLHDTLEGQMPKVRRGQAVQSGWLRIAYGNGALDYTSPHMGPGERGHIAANGRRTLEVPVEIEETKVIKRVRTTMVANALAVPKFDSRTLSFSFPGEEEEGLMKQEPVEQAVAFRGIATVKRTETLISGIHFESGQQPGWILLGEEPEPLDPAA